MINEVQLLNKIENDNKWFIENYHMIEQKFRNKYVALEGGEIIESDVDFNKLLEKLKAKQKDPSTVLIKFVYKIGSVIIFNV